MTWLRLLAPEGAIWLAQARSRRNPRRLCRAADVPHHWLANTAQRQQVLAKVTSSSPRDTQHASYLMQCDLFVRVVVMKPSSQGSSRLEGGCPSRPTFT